MTDFKLPDLSGKLLDPVLSREYQITLKQIELLTTPFTIPALNIPDKPRNASPSAPMHPSRDVNHAAIHAAMPVTRHTVSNGTGHVDGQPESAIQTEPSTTPTGPMLKQASGPSASQPAGSPAAADGSSKLAPMRRSFLGLPAFPRRPCSTIADKQHQAIGTDSSVGGPLVPSGSQTIAVQDINSQPHDRSTTSQVISPPTGTSTSTSTTTATDDGTAPSVDATIRSSSSSSSSSSTADSLGGAEGQQQVLNGAQSGYESSGSEPEGPILRAMHAKLHGTSLSPRRSKDMSTVSAQQPKPLQAAASPYSHDSVAAGPHSRARSPQLLQHSAGSPAKRVRRRGVPYTAIIVNDDSSSASSSPSSHRGGTAGVKTNETAAGFHPDGSLPVRAGRHMAQPARQVEHAAVQTDSSPRASIAPVQAQHAQQESLKQPAAPDAKGAEPTCATILVDTGAEQAPIIQDVQAVAIRLQHAGGLPDQHRDMGHDEHPECTAHRCVDAHTHVQQVQQLVRSLTLSGDGIGQAGSTVSHHALDGTRSEDAINLSVSRRCQGAAVEQDGLSRTTRAGDAAACYQDDLAGIPDVAHGMVEGLRGSRGTAPSRRRSWHRQSSSESSDTDPFVWMRKAAKMEQGLAALPSSSSSDEEGGARRSQTAGSLHNRGSSHTLQQAELSSKQQRGGSCHNRGKPVSEHIVPVSRVPDTSDTGVHRDVQSPRKQSSKAYAQKWTVSQQSGRVEGRTDQSPLQGIGQPADTGPHETGRFSVPPTAQPPGSSHLHSTQRTESSHASQAGTITYDVVATSRTLAGQEAAADPHDSAGNAAASQVAHSYSASDGSPSSQYPQAPHIDCPPLGSFISPRADVPAVGHSTLKPPASAAVPGNAMQHPVGSALPVAVPDDPAVQGAAQQATGQLGQVLQQLCSALQALHQHLPMLGLHAEQGFMKTASQTVPADKRAAPTLIPPVELAQKQQQQGEGIPVSAKVHGSAPLQHGAFITNSYYSTSMEPAVPKGLDHVAVDHCGILEPLDGVAMVCAAEKQKASQYLSAHAPPAAFASPNMLLVAPVEHGEEDRTAGPTQDNVTSTDQPQAAVHVHDSTPKEGSAAVASSHGTGQLAAAADKALQHATHHVPGMPVCHPPSAGGEAPELEITAQHRAATTTPPSINSVEVILGSTPPSSSSHLLSKYLQMPLGSGATDRDQAPHILPTHQQHHQQHQMDHSGLLTVHFQPSAASMASQHLVVARQGAAPSDTSLSTTTSHHPKTPSAAGQVHLQLSLQPSTSAASRSSSDAASINAGSTGPTVTVQTGARHPWSITINAEGMQVVMGVPSKPVATGGDRLHNGMNFHSHAVVQDQTAASAYGLQHWYDRQDAHSCHPHRVNVPQPSVVIEELDLSNGALAAKWG